MPTGKPRAASRARGTARVIRHTCGKRVGVCKACLDESVDKLTPAEFRDLLAAKHIVGSALMKLRHKHADPEGLRLMWSRVSLWLEDNA